MRPAASKLPKSRYFRVVPLPSCALDVLKVLLFTFSPPHCAVEVTKVAHAIKVTKVSLPSCSPPILRPRSYQSITIHCFSMRPAASKLPKCRYFRVPFLSCALCVRKCYYLLFFHPTAPSKLPKCRAPSKLPKWRYLHVPLPSCALEVTKVSLFTVFLCVPQP